LIISKIAPNTNEIKRTLSVPHLSNAEFFGEMYQQIFMGGTNRYSWCLIKLEDTRMQKFINPLDNVSVASPCPVDWNEMYGDNRKRVCSECKLNVYNLSDMTRREAESFLFTSEGRACVRFYRRMDGTVLTKDCPVGWRKIKKRVSKTITAAFSIIIGFVSGVFAAQTVRSLSLFAPIEEVVAPADEQPVAFVGEYVAEPVAGEVQIRKNILVVGRVRKAR
jgi:hypothetical protein